MSAADASAAEGRRGTLPLSVAIVCKDNAATIGRTLESVRGLAGEIIAVDSGSTDGTIELLEGAGARVIRSEWLGHVRTKQKALEACTQPWILSLDSDESPEPELCESIRSLLSAAEPPRHAGYMVNRKIWYRGRFLEHAWQPEWRLRLVVRGRAHWTGADPHDRMELLDSPSPGAADAPAPRAVGRLRGTLRHDSFETFADHLRAQWKHSSVSADGLVRAGRAPSLMKLALSPPGAFVKQIVVKQAWRDGAAGWLAAASTAAGSLMKHAMHLERWQDRKADHRTND